MELTLAEIKQRADSAKEQYPYPDFHGQPLIDLMELYNQQQAEIERLRAALATCHKSLTVAKEVIGHEWRHLKDQTRYDIQAGFEASVKEAREVSGLFSQQQPEPPQESLKVDILRALNKRPFLNSDELSDSLGVTRKSIVLQLRKIHDHASIYALIAFSNFWDGYELTRAGRDYLASLETVNAE